MAIYMVAYDICEESRQKGNADEVVRILSSRWKNSLHIQGSVFFVRTEEPASAIIYSVSRFLQPADKFVVAAVEPESVRAQMPRSHFEWISRGGLPYSPPRKL